MRFELLVATRYLRAKRKQAVISLITFIAILGVGAGVAALVVAMAVSEGQREDIRNRLLGALAHLTITAGPAGIPDYRELAKQIGQVEGVIGAAPHAERGMALQLESELEPVVAKGIIPEMESQVSDLKKNIKSGDLSDLKENTIVVGTELAQRLGIGIGDRVWLMSSATSGSALGLQPTKLGFKVVAIYSIGLFEYDSHLVYIPFDRAAILGGAGDVATNVEVKVRDIDKSAEVGDAIIKKIGKDYAYEDWKVTHKTIFQALKLERLGMAVAISLIVFVAALNIVATLTMMVMEKTRDIATLMSMGATLSQIRRIFMFQGVIIGVMGTAIGLVLGHAISFFADRYELIPLSPEVYSISHLPFRADLSDSLLIALASVVISFVATLYPSSAATRLEPVEALRYE